MDTDELSESGRVVIPDSFGVAPGLQDGVRLDYLVLEPRLALLPLAGGSDGSEVGDDLLCILRLPST